MVHADLSTPSNILVRDGAVVAVVDIGNAGSGTRANDLITLVWYTFQNPQLDDVRERLWTRILDLVGRPGATVLAASHILLMLELPIRQGRHDAVPGVVATSRSDTASLTRAAGGPARHVPAGAFPSQPSTGRLARYEPERGGDLGPVLWAPVDPGDEHVECGGDHPVVVGGDG